ncbi:hypothetical protein KV109_015260 [Bacillus amyloliquefaciens]|uniref:hypothetical protein n=1 Tax=Bacillus amyloliquefaciens TaxID=1390 RepID=UPI001CBE610B|nr:hypothetical protein [Bacillus amyloliquefaciens]MDZ7433225.1 hypothetical protein [Bacillus amyloliquefaciens]
MYYYYPQYQLVPIPCDYRYYPQNQPEDFPADTDIRQFSPNTFIRASIEGLFPDKRRIYIQDAWMQYGNQRVRIIYASGNDVHSATVSSEKIETDIQYLHQHR